MEQRKPNILITNDDGIDAEGIKTIWNALHKYANLTVIAPHTNLSSVSLCVSLKSPLSIHPATWENGAQVWKVNGTPADCIRLGMYKLMDEKPDLIISGINQGSNGGRTILYSGTVGAVIDGAIQGVPGVAFSCAQFHNINYGKLEKYILPVVQYLIENPLPKGDILNVNFPDTTIEFKEFKMAKQGLGYWGDNLEERTHPEGFSYFWMGGKESIHDEHEKSDISLLKEGFITAVPINVSDLTAHQTIDLAKESFEKQVNGVQEAIASASPSV